MVFDLVMIVKKSEIHYSVNRLANLILGMQLIEIKFYQMGVYEEDDCLIGLREFEAALSKSPAIFLEINVKGNYMWWCLDHSDGRWWIWSTAPSSTCRWTTGLTRHYRLCLAFKDELHEKTMSRNLFLHDKDNLAIFECYNDFDLHQRKLDLLTNMNDPFYHNCNT